MKQIKILRINGFSNRFESLGQWLNTIGYENPFHFVDIRDLGQINSQCFLPLHCGGFYQFNDEAWLKNKIESLDKSVIEKIRVGKIILILDGSGEGISTNLNAALNLQKTILQLNPGIIPYYLSSTIDGDKILAKLFLQVKANISLKHIFFPIQLIQVLANCEPLKTLDIEMELDQKLRNEHTKPFLSLNYMPRWWRYALMIFLMKNKFLDRGLVSFYGDHINTSWKKDCDTSHIFLSRRLSNIFCDGEILHYLEKIKSLSPMLVDTDINCNRFDIAYKNISKKLYSSTLFSIVSESDFDNVCGERISEKSFKPLIFGHPSIFIGTPGILKQLRFLGFKTDFEMFDSSYDAIDGGNERLICIFQSLKTLLSLDEHEFKHFYKKSMSDAIYNHVHAKEFPNKSISNLEFFSQLRSH